MDCKGSDLGRVEFVEFGDFKWTRLPNLTSVMTSDHFTFVCQFIRTFAVTPSTYSIVSRISTAVLMVTPPSANE